MESGEPSPSLEVLGYISLSEFFDTGNKKSDLLNKVVDKMRSLDTKTLECFYTISQQN